MAPALPKVRALTAGVDLETLGNWTPVATALGLLARARARLAREGFEVQLGRLSLPPLLARLDPPRRWTSLAHVRQLDAMAGDAGVVVSVGPLAVVRTNMRGPTGESAHRRGRRDLADSGIGKIGDIQIATRIRRHRGRKAESGCKTGAVFAPGSGERPCPGEVTDRPTCERPCYLPNDQRSRITDVQFPCTINRNSVWPTDRKPRPGANPIGGSKLFRLARNGSDNPVGTHQRHLPDRGVPTVCDENISVWIDHEISRDATGQSAGPDVTGPEPGVAVLPIRAPTLREAARNCSRHPIRPDRCYFSKGVSVEHEDVSGAVHRQASG